MHSASPEYNFEVLEYLPDETTIRVFGISRYDRIAKTLKTKAEPRSNGLSEAFVSLAVLWAIAGFSFLTYGLFSYAGRRELGLAATVEDVAFARERLIRKRANAYRGGWLAGIGLACLIIGILLGVRININP